MNIEFKKKPQISKAPSVIEKDVTIEPDIVGFLAGLKDTERYSRTVVAGKRFTLLVRIRVVPKPPRRTSSPSLLVTRMVNVVVDTARYMIFGFPPIS